MMAQPDLDLDLDFNPLPVTDEELARSAGKPPTTAAISSSSDSSIIIDNSKTNVPVQSTGDNSEKDTTKSVSVTDIAAVSDDLSFEPLPVDDHSTDADHNRDSIDDQKSSEESLMQSHSFDSSATINTVHTASSAMITGSSNIAAVPTGSSATNDVNLSVNAIQTATIINADDSTTDISTVVTTETEDSTRLDQKLTENSRTMDSAQDAAHTCSASQLADQSSQVLKSDELNMVQQQEQDPSSLSMAGNTSTFATSDAVSASSSSTAVPSVVVTTSLSSSSNNNNNQSNQNDSSVVMNNDSSQITTKTEQQALNQTGEVTTMKVDPSIQEDVSMMDDADYPIYTDVSRMSEWTIQDCCNYLKEKLPSFGKQYIEQFKRARITGKDLTLIKSKEELNARLVRDNVEGEQSLKNVGISNILHATRIVRDCVDSNRSADQLDKIQDVSSIDGGTPLSKFVRFTHAELELFMNEWDGLLPSIKIAILSDPTMNGNKLMNVDPQFLSRVRIPLPDQSSSMVKSEPLSSSSMVSALPPQTDTISSSSAAAVAQVADVSMVPPPTIIHQPQETQQWMQFTEDHLKNLFDFVWKIRGLYDDRLLQTDVMKRLVTLIERIWIGRPQASSLMDDQQQGGGTNTSMIEDQVSHLKYNLLPQHLIDPRAEALKYAFHCIYNPYGYRNSSAEPPSADPRKWNTEECLEWLAFMNKRPKYDDLMIKTEMTGQDLLLLTAHTMEDVLCVRNKTDIKALLRGIDELRNQALKEEFCKKARVQHCMKQWQAKKRRWSSRGKRGSNAAQSTDISQSGNNNGPKRKRQRKSSVSSSSETKRKPGRPRGSGRKNSITPQMQQQQQHHHPHQMVFEKPPQPTTTTTAASSSSMVVSNHSASSSRARSKAESVSTSLDRLDQSVDAAMMRSGAPSASAVAESSEQMMQPQPPTAGATAGMGAAHHAAAAAAAAAGMSMNYDYYHHLYPQSYAPAMIGAAGQGYGTGTAGMAGQPGSNGAAAMSMGGGAAGAATQGCVSSADVHGQPMDCQSHGNVMAMSSHDTSTMATSDWAMNDAVMSQEEATPRCTVCGKTGSVQRCSNCKQAYYCGRDCQIADWKTHAEQCRKLSAQMMRSVVKTEENVGSTMTDPSPSLAQTSHNNNNPILVEQSS